MGKPLRIGSGKPGPGRPKDVPNKATQATREAFQMLVDGQFDKLNDWINTTAADSPKDAFYMVMDLASFCVPKLKAIEITGEVKQTVVRFVDAPNND
jgi:hypothetical protein